MEQALRANHVLLQSFIDSSLDVIQVFEALRDHSGQIIDFIWLMQNKKGLAQNGEVIGKSLLAQNPGVVESGIFEWMVSVAQTGQPQEHELYYPHEQFEGWFYQAIVKTGDNLLMTTRDITAQKKADREILRLKEQIAQSATDKYLGLFTHIDQGFCLIELLFDAHNKPLDYRFLEINPVFEKQTGLKEAKGKTARELVPNLESHWFEIYGKVALTGESIHFVEGSQEMGRWFEVYAFRLGESESHTVALLFTDISKRKAAEEALQESEKNLRNTIIQAPIAMCMFRGPSHLVEIANERMCELWGKSAEQVVGKPIFEGLPEAKGQGFEALLDKVYQSGETYKAYEVPVRLPRKQGIELVYVNFVYEAFREANGSISGIMAIAGEVTELVLARQKIEESAQQVRSLVESAPFPIGVYVGKEMRIQFANQAILDVWGKGNDVIGKRYAQVLPELENQHIYTQLDGVFTTGVPFHAHNQRVDLVVEGKLQAFYFNYSFTPLYDGEGKVYGVMNTAANVTDLALAKQKVEEGNRNLQAMSEELAASNEELAAANEEILVTNEELAAANKQLLRTNVDLDNFIYTASHDLKAPISNIEALLHALLRSLSEQSRASERVQHITSLMQDSVERFKRTIANLTEVVKLQKDNSEELTSVDVLQVIEEVRLDLEPLIHETRAQLEIEVSSCPQVHFSAKNLRSVIYNLLSNAIKYRFEGRVPHVIISCQNTVGYQVLTIRDNGLGIERERMSQLFTMFKRFHDHVEGTGIGLYMVKRMVDNAGGKIEVDSELGVGSTFRIYFKG